MDQSNSLSHSRARHRARPAPASRGAEWILEAMHHLLDVATAERRG